MGEEADVTRWATEAYNARILNNTFTMPERIVRTPNKLMTSMNVKFLNCKVRMSQCAALGVLNALRWVYRMYRTGCTALDVLYVLHWVGVLSL